MKRHDTFRKVQRVCNALDEVDLDTFFVHPLKLYLFGSLLTDKPDPNDVDLVLQDLRDLAGARAAFEQALAIFEAIEDPNAEKVRRLLAELEE